MTLLIDENLSPRLATMLADIFPGSLHVRDVGLKTDRDSVVWDFAKSRGLVILSKDADFRQRSLLYGPPPKVIGLLVGNCSTSVVEAIVRSNAELIRRFEHDATAAFLELP